MIPAGKAAPGPNEFPPRPFPSSSQSLVYLLLRPFFTSQEF